MTRYKIGGRVVVVGSFLFFVHFVFFNPIPETPLGHNIIFFNTVLLANEDFTIDGTNLIYDTEKGDGNIDWDDNDSLISILQNNELERECIGQ